MNLHSVFIQISRVVKITIPNDVRALENFVISANSRFVIQNSFIGALELLESVLKITKRFYNCFGNITLIV